MSTTRLLTKIEHWALKQPISIAGHVFATHDCLVATLDRNGVKGRGEAVGLYYRKDTPERLQGELTSVRPAIESGATRHDLLGLLPPGGARNALDCALWELESHEQRLPVHALAGQPRNRPLLTTFTCGVDAPHKMAHAARAYAQARALKLKLAGDGGDIERVRAVRGARPDVWIGVDANQSLNPALLEELLPVLVDAGVALIEQPYPADVDHGLRAGDLPMILVGDESVQSHVDVEAAIGRFDAINIKLDKSGGLTEALLMAEAARAAGLDFMVGNMMGTSLATAAAFVLAQDARFVDLDGPIFLRDDHEVRVRYVDGHLHCSDDVWGASNGP